MIWAGVVGDLQPYSSTDEGTARDEHEGCHEGMEYPDEAVLLVNGHGAWCERGQGSGVKWVVWVGRAGRVPEKSLQGWKGVCSLVPPASWGEGQRSWL